MSARHRQVAPAVQPERTFLVGGQAVVVAAELVEGLQQVVMR